MKTRFWSEFLNFLYEKFRLEFRSSKIYDTDIQVLRCNPSLLSSLGPLVSCNWEVDKLAVVNTLNKLSVLILLTEKKLILQNKKNQGFYLHTYYKCDFFHSLADIIQKLFTTTIQVRSIHFNWLRTIWSKVFSLRKRVPLNFLTETFKSCGQQTLGESNKKMV